jgi:hypothetical protein
MKYRIESIKLGMCSQIFYQIPIGHPWGYQTEAGCEEFDADSQERENVGMIELFPHEGFAATVFQELVAHFRSLGEES